MNPTENSDEKNQYDLYYYKEYGYTPEDREALEAIGYDYVKYPGLAAFFKHLPIVGTYVSDHLYNKTIQELENLPARLNPPSPTHLPPPSPVHLPASSSSSSHHITESLLDPMELAFPEGLLRCINPQVGAATPGCVTVMVEGREGLEYVQLKREDIESLLDLEEDESPTDAQLIDELKNHYTRIEHAIPIELISDLSVIHPYESEVTFIDVLISSGDGKIELASRMVGLTQLADYLELDTNAVRQLLKHVDAEQLVLRTTLIPPSHLQEFREGTGWNDRQGRAAAIISDIIFDKEPVTESELHDFGTALGRPISYESGVLTIGEPKLLGEGTSASVHEGRIETLGSADPTKGQHRYYGVVASKKQNPSVWVDDEVRIGLELNGIPYVVTTLFLRHNEGQSIAVSAAEPCNGGTVNEDNPDFQALPAVAKFRILSQMLQGLDGIHGRGYVHCDVKGANIALTKVAEGLQPRIIDFGLTAPIGLSDEQERVSPGHRPPEYHENPLMPINPAIDAFSAGIVALRYFLAITPGWFPPADESESELDEEDLSDLGEEDLIDLEQMIKDEIPVLMQLIDAKEDVPLPIREAIKMLIDLDPAKRNIPLAIDLIEQGIHLLE